MIWILHKILKSGGIYKMYNKYLNTQITGSDIPNHVGIILDGNRRWAVNNNSGLGFGHKAGANVATELLEWCHELKIKTLTIYALSDENLNRSQEELEEIFRVIEMKLYELLSDKRIIEYEVRITSIGKIDQLPKKLQTLLNKLESNTAKFDNHYLNIALVYGGRSEIIDCFKKIISKYKEGEIELDDITQKTIDENLYTSHLSNPEPDVIIRTSGEERLSDFLIWQSAYSELIFLDVYWADFRKIDLMRAIRTYQKRSRRFGK